LAQQGKFRGGHGEQDEGAVAELANRQAARSQLIDEPPPGLRMRVPSRHPLEDFIANPAAQDNLADLHAGEVPGLTRRFPCVSHYTSRPRRLFRIRLALAM